MRLLRFTSCVAALVLAASAGAALGEEDSGSASQYPWSGYWWAHGQGGLTPPLSKYDQAFGTKAADWERRIHVETDNVQPWFGHCHAWSAASVTEKEPREPRDFKGVKFGVGDLKGLLTSLHAQDEATSYGDRFGDGNGSEDKGDVPPDEVWRLLQLYVKQRNIPLIFDLEAGDEVWNFPVYQYEVSHQESGDGYVNGSMQLVVADDDVHPDYLGTQPGIYSYTFRCKMQGGSVVAGSGEWTGESVDDHPDFAWYPYVARAENPDVDPAKVSKILGYQAGGGSHPEDGVEETPNPNPAPPREGGSGSGGSDVAGGPDDSSGPDNPSRPDVVGGSNVVSGPSGLNGPITISGPGPAEPIPLDLILSPIETVSLLSNKVSHFSLDVFVDRNDGGKYNVGEPIRVAAESGQAGYLYLFDIGPHGEMRLIFPTPGEPNAIPANKLVDIPAKGMEAWLAAELPGEHHLRGVVTTEPLALTGFHTQAQFKLKDKGKEKPKLKPQPKPQPQRVQVRYEPRAYKVRVPPATYACMSRKLRGFYGAKSLEEEPPVKLGKSFAQDDCLFYVIGKGNAPQGGR